MVIPLRINVLTGWSELYLSHEHIEILSVRGELLFFKQRDGPYIPTLRLLHKCESEDIIGSAH